MKRHVAFTAALGLVLTFVGVATAASISPGDLIVVDRGNGTLDDVNPITGASTVIASGFSNPQGLAINSQGMIFVSDIGTSTIDLVNPVTGVVTTFSGNGVGSGPTLSRPFEMAFNSSGTLEVADGQTPNGNSTNILAIAPNGNRTLVVGNNGSSNNIFVQSLAGLTLDAQGNIYVSAPTGPAVYRAGIGTATLLTTTALAPQGLAIGAAGQLLAASGNPSNPLIYSINPSNGNTTVLADNNGIGTGPLFNSVRGLTVGPTGTIYATDVGTNVIYAVNPANGNRSVISGNGIGGTTFGALTYGIAVYPTLVATVPEPSSIVLFALGTGGLILTRWRGRSRPCA